MAVKKTSRRKAPRKRKETVKKIAGNKIVVGIFLVVLGLFSGFSYISFNAGIIGNLVSQGFSYVFGGVTLFVSLYLVVLGVMIGLNKLVNWRKNFALIFLLLINLMMAFSLNIPNFFDYSLLDFFSLAQYGQYGGIIGILLVAGFTKLFSSTGTVIFLVLSTLIIVTIIFRNSIRTALKQFKEKNKNTSPIKERFFEKIAIVKDQWQIRKEIKEVKQGQPESIPLVNEKPREGKLFEPLDVSEGVQEEVINLLEKKPLFEPVMKFGEKKNEKLEKDPFGFINSEALDGHFEASSVKTPLFEKTSKNGATDKTLLGDVFSEFAETKLIKKNTAESESQESEAYVFPSLDLLNLSVKKDKSKKDDVFKKAKKIEETLKNFGVKAKIIEVSVGPSITRFELQLDPGVKVNKILNLSNDLALSLASSDIRIEAPIPGKAAVGIEVPNDVSEIVGLREIVETDQFKNSKSPLSFALGKTLSGESVVGDIGKMPHVLIAGATGSGKSVCINSIIVSLLYKSSPDELRFIMIDPKMVELNQYNAIPHLLIPVVTEPKKAAYALNWGLNEMNNRYTLFKENNVRDIEGYNRLMEKSDEKKLPRIVIVIDELADLMLTSPKEVENAICRIAQLARACGIHLIIATQRPSVDVITGLIKANIPSRIAFAVASNTDSRTILDSGGAEKLLGKGDMLYFPTGQSKPTRVQCTYLSDDEINRVIAAVSVKKGAQYDPRIEEAVFQEAESKAQAKERDDLLEDAISIGFEYNQLSTSMLQRKLQVGYARAGRIIDDLEDRGIISGPNGSKPRKLLLTKEEYTQGEGL